MATVRAATLVANVRYNDITPRKLYLIPVVQVNVASHKSPSFLALWVFGPLSKICLDRNLGESLRTPLSLTARYIYLHEWLIFMARVGKSVSKFTIPMVNQ